MFPDYYKIFSLSTNSSPEEIKKRYRELVKKYHPDVNDSPDATQKMQEIQEAYYILNDQEARGRYNIQYAKYFEFERISRVKYRPSEEEHQNGENVREKFEFNDPILEKWIINARRQSIEFMKSAVRDTKWIIANGCLFYFKAVGYIALLIIVLILLVRIYFLF